MSYTEKYESLNYALREPAKINFKNHGTKSIIRIRLKHKIDKKFHTGKIRYIKCVFNLS